MEPADSLAFIGRNPGEENVFIATGDSGHGMTHGTIAGMMLTDLILGHQNPWAALYDPSRKPTHALGEFARENLNVAQLPGVGAAQETAQVPPPALPAPAVVRGRCVRLRIRST